MKQSLYPQLFRIFLLTLIGSLIIGCQPISATVTPVVMNQPALTSTSTATAPQETPIADSTQIASGAMSPDRHLLVAQTSDGAWWMWDLFPNNPAYLLNDTSSHAPPMHRPTFSPDARYLAAISMGHVLLWEVALRKRRVLKSPYSIEYRSMRLLVFSPDSQLLANNGCEQQNSHMVCTSGFVNLWNTSDGTLLRTLSVGFRVDDMSYSTDNTILTVSGCSITDGVIGSYCYEKSQATYQIDSGELLTLTRVPQYQ